MNRQLSLVLLFTLFVATIGNAASGELQIVCLGTSFTNGKGVPRNQAWPARLETDLKAAGLPVHISNQGVNGDTTLDLKWRVKKAVPEGTSLVILEYALGNDKRSGIAIEETISNVDEIVSGLVSNGVRVLLVIRANNAGRLERIAKRFEGTVSRFGISTINIEQPPSSLLSDGRHPTAEAHARIAASMVNPVRSLLAEPGIKQ